MLTMTERDVYLDRIGKYAAQIARIQSALGTCESGDALVVVALQARADQKLLARVEAELEDNHDLEWEGGPNAYMRITSFIEDLKEGRRK